MTKKTKETTQSVQITFLLDTSGSMASLKEAVQAGLHNFVTEQKVVPGNLHFNLLTFDQSTENARVEYSGPINKFKDYKYDPNGPSTALYDNLELALNHAESQTNEIFDKRLFIIYTDGIENSSRKITREAINKRISELQDKGWEFAYLGANQDSWESGQSIGIRSASATLDYAADSMGVTKSLQRMSRSVSEYRSCSTQDFSFVEN